MSYPETRDLEIRVISIAARDDLLFLLSLLVSEPPCRLHGSSTTREENAIFMVISGGIDYTH